MEEKKIYQENRDSLQLFIYKVINPLVNGLVKAGFTPNMVTTIGFLGNVAAAAMFVMAGIGGQSAGVAYDWFLWGGVVLILFSLFDMLDGQVARLGGMASTFGAMYDSVLDRYSELVTLGGLCYAMMQTRLRRRSAHHLRGPDQLHHGQLRARPVPKVSASSAR